MKTNFSVLFFLKKPKNYTKGAVYFIFLRITVDGIRAEMSTSRSCEQERWNAKAEVYAAHTLLTVDGARITADNIKCKYLGKAEKSHTLSEAIKIHNAKMKALVGKDYAKGTLKRFEVLERHVCDYLTFQYGKSDLNVKHVDHEFISGFDFYLRSQKANTNNTAIKHLKNLGKIIRICVSNKWISNDPFFGYKLKSKEVHRNYLTADELQNNW